MENNSKKILTATSITLILTISSFLINSNDGFVTNFRKVLSIESDVTNDATIAFPTPTSTSTSSASISPGATPTPKNCNSYCGISGGCPSNYTCYFGYCRYSLCPNENDCDCGQSISPTPIISPSPKESIVPIGPFPAPKAPSGKFVIYGYAPSRSSVHLSGIAVSEEASSDQSGYFEFRNLYFPTILSYLIGNWYPELCITAQDENRITTNPVCIPTLPLTSTSRKIGPILLPPTLKVSSGVTPIQKPLIASGKTTPNSDVEVFIAKSVAPRDILTIVKEVIAYYIPTYHTTSDSEGNFEFSLPNNDATTWKVFTASNVLGAKTAKSNTLTVNILPTYSNIFGFLMYILAILRPYLIYLIISIQIIIVGVLVRHTKRKNNGKEKIKREH